jgi:hypothetical protein
VKIYSTAINTESIHRVAISLQDDKHKGTVYAKIKGTKLGKQVIEQSISHVLNGEIYSDAYCSQLLDDEYIHIFRTPSRKKDFVYLIERKFAEDYIVAVNIIDCYAIEEDDL